MTVTKNPHQIALEVTAVPHRHTCPLCLETAVRVHDKNRSQNQHLLAVLLMAKENHLGTLRPGEFPRAGMSDGTDGKKHRKARRSIKDHISNPRPRIVFLSLNFQQV